MNVPPSWNEVAVERRVRPGIDVAARRRRAVVAEGVERAAHVIDRAGVVEDVRGHQLIIVPVSEIGVRIAVILDARREIDRVERLPLARGRELGEFGLGGVRVEVAGVEDGRIGGERGLVVADDRRLLAAVGRVGGGGAGLHVRNIDIKDAIGADVVDRPELVAGDLAVFAVLRTLGVADADGGDQVERQRVVDQGVGAVAVGVAAALDGLQGGLGVGRRRRRSSCSGWSRSARRSRRCWSSLPGPGCRWAGRSPEPAPRRSPPEPDRSPAAASCRC